MKKSMSGHQDFWFCSEYDVAGAGSMFQLRSPDVFTEKIEERDCNVILKGSLKCERRCLVFK
jgi:hypothetical protein